MTTEITTRYPFAALEAVLSYGVDSSHSYDQTPLFDELELNPVLFCARLYVPRPDLEAELLEYIKNAPHVVQVEGPAGCGKTSTLTAILRRMNETEGFLVLTLDFKQIAREYGERLEKEHEVAAWFDSYLCSCLRNRLTKDNISDADIALVFLDPKAYNHLLSDEGEKSRRALLDQYRIQTLAEDQPPPQVEWFRDQLTRQQTKVTKLSAQLTDSLRAKDLLFALLNIWSAEEPTKIILLLDNLDSIRSGRIRAEMKAFIPKYQHVLGGVAKIVSCQRPETEEQMEMTADYGSFHVNSVNLDRWEWVNDEAFERLCNECIERKGFCNPRDKEAIKKKLYRDARRRFDNLVVARRLDFFREQVGEGRVEGADRRELTSFREWCEAVVSNKHVNELAAALSNGDRRKMLRHLTRFVRYLREYIGLELSNLGASERERERRIESYFYSWLVDREEVYDVDSYNIVSATEAWYEGSGSEVGCLITHLVLSCIYNMTAASHARYHVERTTSVRLVMETCGKIGLSEEEVRQFIFWLYRDERSYAGLLEASRYHSVRSPADIAETDELALSLRARFLLEYVGEKFFFLTALMRRAGVRSGRQKFDYNDNFPLTRHTVREVLRYVCRIARMHLEGLVVKQEMLESEFGETWFTWYRSHFCIDSTAGSHYKDRRGNLMIENVVGSHVKFLQRCMHTVEEQYEKVVTRGIVDEYRRFLERFREQVELIEDGESEGQDLDFEGGVDFSVFEEEE